MGGWLCTAPNSLGTAYADYARMQLWLQSYMHMLTPAGNLGEMWLIYPYAFGINKENRKDAHTNIKDTNSYPKSVPSGELGTNTTRQK